MASRPLPRGERARDAASAWPAYDGGGCALDHDVDTGRLAAGDRTLQRRPQLARLGDERAVSAERRGDEVVAGRQQLAAVRAVRPILAQLDLVFRVPGGIVADHGHERQ